MLALEALKSHMHQVENYLQSCKPQGKLTKVQIDYFLKSVDVAKQILEGQPVTPLSPPEEKRPDDESSRPRPRKTALPKAKDKAIVIDDEPEIVKLMVDILTEAGFETQGHVTPDSALRAIQEWRPHLVLTDIAMPNINGLDVLKKVRTMDPDLPVVFVSGHVDKTTLLEAMSYGIYSVIEKPFRPAEILSIAINAASKMHTAKLLRRSINLLMYQFSDLDQMLSDKNQFDLRNSLKSSITELLKNFRLLKPKELPRARSSRSVPANTFRRLPTGAPSGTFA